MGDGGLFDDGGELMRLAARLSKAGPIAGARAFGLVRKHGITLQSRVKANAAGRPGPRWVSGDYNRSIGLTMRRPGLSVSEAVVGTNKPQGKRLEFGFVGEDSAGRTYNQPPLPHFGPAGEETRPEFESDVADLGAEVIRGALHGL